MTPKQRDVVGLLLFVSLPLAVGALAGLSTASSVGGWYRTIAKPSWNPPSWVFGPMWTLLYASMGVAAWRVWRPAGFAAAKGALTLFFVQLAVNGLWSPIFFAWHRPDLALVDIGILLALVAATLVAFRRHDRIAGGLFVPYLLWVAFATALNFAIWRLSA